MRIKQLHPESDWKLFIVAADGRAGVFDVQPYLDDEAFRALKCPAAFTEVTNGGYFVEWACGADLSADTIEARWELAERRTPTTAA
ncbi:MAG: DUF2442 domain-containing protein [Acidobacteriota bacterium]